MRQLALGLVIAAALGASAAAQPTTPYQSGYTTATSPLGLLPQSDLQWMAQETLDQANAPKSLADLDVEIEAAVGEDMDAVAKRARMKRADMVSAMRFEIVRTARRMLDEDVRDRTKAQASGEVSDNDMLNLQSAISRRTRLKALEEQASRRLTDKARTIISD